MSRLSNAIQTIASGFLFSLGIVCALFPLTPRSAKAAHVGGDGEAYHGDGSNYSDEVAGDIFREPGYYPNNVLEEVDLGYISDALGENDPLVKASALTDGEKRGKSEDEINALIQAKRDAIPMTSGPFSFEPGAALYMQNDKRLGFTINLTRTEETWKIAESQKTGKYGGIYRYKFYLVRENGNQKETDLSVTTYVFQNARPTAKTYRGSAILDKDKYDTTEDVIQVPTKDFSEIPYAFDWGQESTEKIYSLKSQGTDPFGDDYVESLPEFKQKYHMKVYFDLEKLGVYTSYRVYFSYEYVPIVEKTENQDWFLWIHWGNGTYNYAFGEPESYLIKSDERSYYQVLNNLTNAGAFDPESESDSELQPTSNLREFWIKLLNDEGNAVNIEYLVNIEGTPFAHKERAQITMRTTNVEGSTLMPDDVAAALGEDNIFFNSAPVETFIYDSSKSAYVAKYYNFVNLKAVTTEGQTMNYYLNPNMSFREFYFSFVIGEDPVITSDCYSYMIGALKGDYPQLAAYQDTEIYGFWGYVVIPRTHLFSDLFASIQNKDTAFNGIYKHYEQDGNLSLGAYNRLLGEEYGYGWLQIVFSDLISSISAGGNFDVKHYFVYADGQYTKSSINQTGSADVDDSTSVLNQDMQAAAKIAMTTIDNVNKVVQNTLSTVGDNVPTILIFAGVVGGIALIIYINNKSGVPASGSARSSAKRSSGTRRSSTSAKRGKRK